MCIDACESSYHESWVLSNRFHFFYFWDLLVLLTNGGKGTDLFLRPLYMKWGSFALPGLKIGSSTIPLLSLVMIRSGLAVVVVVEAEVVEGADVVVSDCDTSLIKFWLISRNCGWKPRFCNCSSGCCASYIGGIYLTFYNISTISCKNVFLLFFPKVAAKSPSSSLIDTLQSPPLNNFRALILIMDSLQNPHKVIIAFFIHGIALYTN